MPSIQVKMISGLFKLIGVNRMLWRRRLADSCMRRTDASGVFVLVLYTDHREYDI